MRLLFPIDECIEPPAASGIYEFCFVGDVIARKSIKALQGPTARSCGDAQTNALMLAARDREKMLEGAAWVLLFVIPFLLVIGLCWNDRPRKRSRRW
jgi:hypothetical protein